MGFSILPALASAVEGFVETGNPEAAAAMGVAGGFSGGTPGSSLAGGIGNAQINALNQQAEEFQVGMYGEQVRHQEQMQLQSTAFDEMMDEKSEQMREVNTLRDVQMAQRKADNSITKKFIESITE